MTRFQTTTRKLILILGVMALTVLGLGAKKGPKTNISWNLIHNANKSTLGTSMISTIFYATIDRLGLVYWVNFSEIRGQKGGERHEFFLMSRQ